MVVKVKAQGAACCCRDVTPPPDPCLRPCIQVELDGLFTPNCGCHFAPLLNNTYTLTYQGGDLWMTQLCPPLEAAWCGYGTLYVQKEFPSPGVPSDYTFRVILDSDWMGTGFGRRVVWKKVWFTKPDCGSWVGEEFQFDAGESNVQEGSDLRIDATGSVARVTMLPIEAECSSGGLSCEEQELEQPAACDFGFDGYVGIDDVCADRRGLPPPQVKLIIPGGAWQAVTLANPPSGCLTGDCPTGEFVIDRLDPGGNRPCWLIYEMWFPISSEHRCMDNPVCQLIYLSVQIGRADIGGGAFWHNVVASVSFTDGTDNGKPIFFGDNGICPTEQRGGSTTTWGFCGSCDGFMGRPLDCDFLFTGELLTLPFAGCGINYRTACCWNGDSSNYTNTPGCGSGSAPLDRTPIQIQFIN